jgi:CubicO group peptidase (beta-lactamase class C family)
MRPRDILKIGILFSADGVWNGKQILDKEWAQKAVQPHIAISPATTGLSEDEFNNEYFGGFSGYHWRIDTVITPNGKKYQSYEATGNGGQIVLVVPDLDITAVFTGGNYRMGYIWGRWRNEIIGKYIIPSMVR